MKAGVETALQELAEGLPDNTVEPRDDGSGGAFVLVHGLEIGASFAPISSWVGFHLTFTCPEADVYPHFIDSEVQYVGDGPAPNQHPDGDLPMAMSRGATMPGFERAAIQISRRTKSPQADSALGKLLRILDFLRSR